MSVPMFRGKRTLGLRLWHWANSLLIAGMVLTVVLRDYLVNVREHAKAIQDLLGSAVTPDQARDVALSYKNALWGWHVKMGLSLCALLALRVIVEFAAPKGSALCTKIKTALSPAAGPNGKMVAAVKLSHALFYLGLTAILATGVLLAYGRGWGMPDSLRGPIREVHETMMYAILAFVAAHVIGVVKAEVTTDPGLVSDMIHGG